MFSPLDNQELNFFARSWFLTLHLATAVTFLSNARTPTFKHARDQKKNGIPIPETAVYSLLLDWLPPDEQEPCSICCVKSRKGEAISSTTVLAEGKWKKDPRLANLVYPDSCFRWADTGHENPMVVNTLRFRGIVE